MSALRTKGRGLLPKLTEFTTRSSELEPERTGRIFIGEDFLAGALLLSFCACRGQIAERR